MNPTTDRFEEVRAARAEFIAIIAVIALAIAVYPLAMWILPIMWGLS